MKNKKIILIVNIFLMLVFVFNIVQAVEKTGKSYNDVNNIGSMPRTEIDNYYNEAENGVNVNITKFNASVSKITGVLLLVLQVASIIGIIYAGISYIIAPPDGKADIKKRLGHLAIGMIIVFGASTVVGFITGVFKDVFENLI